MIANPTEIAALNQFFSSVNLPQQLKINRAIRFTDLPMFVTDNLQKLKDGTMSAVVGKPRYDDLLRIKEVLISGETFEGGKNS